MKRYITFITLLAAVGCGDANPEAGSGGAGGEIGAGGEGGGGVGGIGLCETVDCDDGNECTEANCNDGVCDNPPVGDAVACSLGELPGVCEAGVCRGLCEGVTCEDTECKSDGVCDPSNGVCDFTLAEDGTACGEGECLDGVCAPIGAFSCTEQGIRDAIAQGGGPHFFACDGPTTVVINAVLMIDNDVILDGEGQLAVEGEDTHPMLEVAAEGTVELRRFELGNSEGEYPWWDIVNLGMLTLTRSRLVTSRIKNDGTLTIADSAMAKRPDWNVGAAISNTGVLVVTNSSFRGVHIANFAATVVDGSTFSGTSTPPIPSDLSGIYNRETGTVTLKNSTVSGSGSIGIENAGGTMTIENSTIFGNLDRGIYNYGALTMTYSTVSGTGIGLVREGGGIRNFQDGTMTVTHSTVSDNATNGDGGGISNGGTLTLTHSTVSDNAADGSGDGISNGGTLTLTHSVVGDDCYMGTAIISTGYTIESPGDTCGFDHPTDRVSVSADDLKLGPLQDNGGPTETHALLPGSVAIDVIPADVCEATDDQRGFPRDSMCDVGAFEVQEGSL